MRLICVVLIRSLLGSLRDGLLALDKLGKLLFKLIEPRFTRKVAPPFSYPGEREQTEACSGKRTCNEIKACARQSDGGPYRGAAGEYFVPGAQREQKQEDAAAESCGGPGFITIDLLPRIAYLLAKLTDSPVVIAQMGLLVLQAFTTLIII
jgi:hypothetical protein